MCFSTPKIPKAPAPPQKEDAMVARDRELQKRAMAQGFNSTIMTSPMGGTNSPASVQKKALLGG